jgi:autotransporter-associated beta strand protein
MVSRIEIRGAVNCGNEPDIAVAGFTCLSSASESVVVPSHRAHAAGMRRAVMPRIVLTAILAIVLHTSVHGQTTYTWSTSTTSTTWLNSANWTGGTANKYPGLDANESSTADGTTTDIALFSTLALSANTVGINFNTSANTGDGDSTGANGSLTLGTIDFNPSKALTIRNTSSVLDGTLTLTGSTLNTIANTILANEGSENVTLTNATASDNSRRMDLALGNTTNNVIQINGSGDLTITSLIKNGTGASNLTLTSTGTPTGQLILNGTSANTFTGTTTIDKGTLNLVTAGSLGSTTGITVNNGGTLLLSGTSGVTDRMNNSAPITLDGGTFHTGGLSEGSASAGGAGVGALTLTANSTIDFGSGTSILHFSGLGAHTSATGPDILIINWSGLSSGGGTDQLLFSGAASDFTSSFDQSDISFNGVTGYNVVPFDGFYEITAVPEPATIFGGMALLGLVGFRERKRLRGLWSTFSGVRTT